MQDTQRYLNKIINARCTQPEEELKIVSINQIKSHTLYLHMNSSFQIFHYNISLDKTKKKKQIKPTNTYKF